MTTKATLLAWPPAWRWTVSVACEVPLGSVTLAPSASGAPLTETVAFVSLVMRRLVSVFADNAGVVRFDEENDVCFKVETHNHPSAIDPYGGANTGLGGVIRDVLGTGLGAKPIANTDVFCVAPPDTDPASLPPVS